MYCDNGIAGHSLPSSAAPCTANGNMPQGYQTPYQGTSTEYYVFHTNAYPQYGYASNDAQGDYLFYFR